jgi:AhpD family alkylhydroperoxidase
MSQPVTNINIASDPKVAELVALGAAVGSNCEACFRSHYETARTVGVSTDEIVQALSVAEAVKETPARRMRELAARKLGVPVSAFSTQAPTPGAEGEQGDLAGGDAAQSEPAQAATACC